MVDCSRFMINRELHARLSARHDLCDTNKWMTTIGNMKARITIDIPNLLDFYTIKKSPVNAIANGEKKILKHISNDLLLLKAPMVFPFLYADFVCENTLTMIMHPYDITLERAVEKNKYSIEWWVQTLYQLCKAVYYLEEQNINHNNISLQTVAFQNVSKDYNDIAIMLTDFSSSIMGKAIIGRDLNYFIYTLIHNSVNAVNGVKDGYFPEQLAHKLEPFLLLENMPKHHNEDQYSYGLRRATITHNNVATSGKSMSRWFVEHYPFVSDRCSLDRLDKLFGAGIGSILGDALGMPIEFDYVNDQIVNKMYPSAQFNGLLSWANLPAGTFTDDTHMSLALIDAIQSQGRTIVPRSIAREFKRWANTNPPDIGAHTQKVLGKITKDGSNWETVSRKVYKDNTESAANGATMRVWPIAILHHYDDISSVVDSAIKQAIITHMNPDAVYASVFVSCLIHQLINGVTLEPAINNCLSIIKPFVTKKLYKAISVGHLLDYDDLTGGHGWIVHTMTVVMWSIRNTNTFSTALIRAANVRGDTDTNAAITGAIAGALYGFKAIPQGLITPLDKYNKWNVWHGKHMNISELKDRIATLARC